MQFEIHQQKAIEYLLKQQYLTERGRGNWIDSFDKDNFLFWLRSEGFISQEHLELQLEELRKEE